VSRRRHGVPTRAGRDYTLALLPEMNAAGLAWLTPVIEDMAGGDPWQEGSSALDIAEAWVRAGKPGPADHQPGEP
jgi:hypothetical protein